MWTPPFRFPTSDRHRGSLTLVIVLALAGFSVALLLRPGSAIAAGNVADRAGLAGTPQPATGSDATPAPAPSPTASPTSSAPPIVENIFHIIQFPFQTMTDAVVQMSNKILLQSYSEAGQRFAGALDKLVSGPYGIAPDVADGAPTPLFANLIYPHWQVVLAVALLLLPVTLILTAVSALRLGATSALGLADLKEAVLGWLVSAGAAGSSYYLLSLAHRLSVAAAGSLLAADFGTRVTGATLAGAFFNVGALLALAGNLLTSPIVLYLAFFALFLASTVMLGLGLALAAYTALAYLLTTMAPLVLVLGALPPLRWLQALWLKSVVITFLLPVVDALLLKAAVSLFYSLLSAEGSGDVGTFIAGIFTTAGVISVLIMINFKVGESVFGALAEVHRQALDATMGVVNLVAMAAGFAAGGLAIGAGSAAAAGAAGGGEAGAVTAGGLSPVGGPTGGGAASAQAAGPASSSVGTLRSGAGSLQPGANGGAGSPGIAQRMQQLLSGSQATSSDAAPAGQQADQPADHEQPGQETSTVGQNGSSGTASGTETHGEQASGRTMDLPTQGTPTGEAQLRRARLAGSFGRALAHNTRNPVLQGLGAGLQAGELATTLRTEIASGAGRGTPTGATNTASPTGALRWSNHDLSNLPNDLFDPSRDNTELMAGGLHQAFVSSGRAM